jgi:serine/threonine protein kinase
MGFVVTCESCQKRLSIPAALYDKKVKGRVVTITCRSCQAPIRIDATIPPPPDEYAGGMPAGPPSSPPPSARSAAPRSVRAPASVRSGGPASTRLGAPSSSNGLAAAALIASPPPLGLIPADLEFPHIPRAPALPDDASEAAALASNLNGEAGYAFGAEPSSLPAADEPLDEGWEEVGNGQAMLEASQALMDARADGGVSPLVNARGEERTRPERISLAPAVPSFPEEFGPEADARARYSSEDSVEHVDGPLSMRAPIASIGRYTLFDKFAVGGMATVHLGRIDGAGGFSRVVALKRLLPHLIHNEEFVEMLLKEARLAGRVRHPNVVPTLDVVASKGEVLIVLEYVHGESLSAMCRSHADRKELIPIDIAVGVMIDVFSGLDAVHEAKDERGRPLGLVHRDVSPANVLVGIDGLARVLDFGIVKALQLVEETIPNRLKGKTGYMSPEQTRGDRVTRRADVFSGGIVLWELLTLHRFASGKSDKERMDRILSGKYERPDRYRPEIPAALCDVVMKALAYDPEDRYETALELAEALGAAYSPASKGAIVDWVRRLAESSLAERGRMVAQVENWTGGTREPELSSSPFAAEARAFKSEDEARGSLPPGARPNAAAKSDARWLGLPVLAIVALGVLIVYLLTRGG